MNTRALKINGIVSLLNKMVSVLSSIIIPRLMIMAFGSESNGLIAGINQYLYLIAVLDLGMGAVIQASLYQPLVEGDWDKVSKIYDQSKRFFNRIGIILLFYISSLTILLPLILRTNFSRSEIVGLVLILSLSQITQFFLGINNQILLQADQKGFINEGLHLSVNLLNIVLVYFLVYLQQSIFIVRLGSALVFIIPPVVMALFVQNTYGSKLCKTDNDFQLSQKWYGIGQHLAYTIQESTDMIILSIFTSLTTVSIYSVYNTVFYGLKTIFFALFAGLRPYFGQLLYRDDRTKLAFQFRMTEWLIHNIATLVMTTCLLLVSPFVKLYVTSSSDINYQAPLFGYIMSVAVFFYLVRLPYRTLVFAGGQFRETQIGTYFEAIINILISVLLVVRYGLEGVAWGTLFSLAFSCFYYAIFTYQKILHLPIKFTLKHLALDIMVGLILILVSLQIKLRPDSVLHWLCLGIILISVGLTISLCLNILMYPKETRWLVAKMSKGKRSH